MHKKDRGQLVLGVNFLPAPGGEAENLLTGTYILNLVFVLSDCAFEPDQELLKFNSPLQGHVVALFGNLGPLLHLQTNMDCMISVEPRHQRQNCEEKAENPDPGPDPDPGPSHGHRRTGRI